MGSPSGVLQEIGAAVLRLAEEGRPFTSDDLFYLSRYNATPQQICAVLRSAERRGIIRRTGNLRRSERQESRGRRLREWEGRKR